MHRKEQIKGFLHGVQEIRETRTRAVLAASVGNIFAAALPPGIAEEDPALRERAEQEVMNLGIEGPQNTSDKMVSVRPSLFPPPAPGRCAVAVVV